MKSHCLYFVVLSGLCAAAPLADSGYISPYKIHTTEGRDGSIIDWVPVNDQVDDDEVSSAPPMPEIVATFAVENATMMPEPINASEHQGPDGTVPVVRQYGRLQDVKSPPQTSDPEYAQQIHIGKRKAGDHWYASSSQNVANHGGSATYSLYKAWTESGADFSLLQSAVIKYNVKNPLYNDPNRLAMQTVEAGWYVAVHTSDYIHLY